MNKKYDNEFLRQIILYIHWEADEEWESLVEKFLDEYEYIQTDLSYYDLEESYSVYDSIFKHIEDGNFYKIEYIESPYDGTIVEKRELIRVYEKIISKAIYNETN